MSTELLIRSCDRFGFWFRGEDLKALYRRMKQELPSCVVEVWEVSSDHDKVWVDGLGTLRHEIGYRPRRVALMYLAPGKKPAPVKKGQFNPTHKSHEEWLAADEVEAA
jgi:hypothetical protein